jgi:hypothetical protein
MKHHNTSKKRISKFARAVVRFCIVHRQYAIYSLWFMVYDLWLSKRKEASGEMHELQVPFVILLFPTSYHRSPSLPPILLPPPPSSLPSPHKPSCWYCCYVDATALQVLQQVLLQVLL